MTNINKCYHKMILFWIKNRAWNKIKLSVSITCVLEQDLCDWCENIKYCKNETSNDQITDNNI